MRFYIVDAFTDKIFDGNPAGVVLIDNDKNFPQDDIMQKTAAELRYSETAFVYQNNTDEFTIRYFTPKGEVDLCGHATIAAFSVLVKEGIISLDTQCFNNTKAGRLNIIAGNEIMMQMAEPQLLKTLNDQTILQNLYSIMGADYSTQRSEYLPYIISTGLADIIMPIRNAEILNSLKPDMVALSSFSEHMKVVGVHAFSLEQDDDFTAHVRNFAPLFGIDEESATGTANGALTYWLYLNNMLKNGDKCNFLQGEAMMRPSIITTQLSILNDKCNISVGGKAVILAQGEIFI